MTPHPALPPGALIAACQSMTTVLSDAVLNLLIEDHATQVASMRLYDAKPPDDPNARHYARWSGKAQRRARRIRVALRECGCRDLAERLGLLAVGVVPVTPNDGAAP